jgi:hypothetical protein
MTQLLSKEETVAELSLAMQMGRRIGGVRPLYSPFELRHQMARIMIRSSLTPPSLHGPDLEHRLIHWIKYDLEKVRRGRKPGTRLRRGRRTQ